MTATSRLRSENPTSMGRDPYVIALVGFATPLPANGRGILQRCELTPVELPDVEQACRLLERVTFDAIVLDGHHPKLHELEPFVGRLLATLDSRTSLVMLTGSGTSPELRKASIKAGACVVPSSRQTYREIADLIRTLRRIPGPCCGRLPDAL